MSSECREIVREYLRAFPGWAIFLGVIGLVLILVGVSASEGSRRNRDAVGVALAFGLILALISIVVIVFRRRPSDAEFDRCLGHALRATPRGAIRKLGLEDSDVLGKYVYFWTPPAADVAAAEAGTSFVPNRFRRGRDQRYRFASYNVMILVPTETHLGVYTASMDLLSWAWQSEATGEYFYRDVVSIQTRPGTLALTFRDSRAFELAFPTGWLAEALYEVHDVPFVPMADAAQVVRKMIQPHKLASA
jgi:hypothetical protein